VQRLAPVQTRVSVIAGSSLVGATVTVLGLLLLWSLQVDSIWVVLFLAPILVVATAPALARQAARERDRWLFQLLVAALVLKLVGSLIRYYVSFELYGGVVDSAVYHEMASAISERLRGGNFDTGLESLSGTNFVPFFTSLLYTVIGPNIFAGYLLFSWLAFWGLFYLYRAFTIAMPGGNRRSYAHLLFFLPSILYWPSSIGKDAWMLFTLGLAAYGAARILSGLVLRGAVVAGVGLWLAALVRPHVAGMAGLGLAVAYMVGRTRRRAGWQASAMKLLGLAAVLVLAGLLLSQTTAFLKDSGLDPEEGVTSVLAENAERTEQGGSSFDAPPPGISPVHLPLSLVTILFRPFLFEANSIQVLITALESTVLLVLTLRRIRPMGRAVRSFRRLPYVTFVVVYGLLFIVAFSSIGNFGILARERCQLLPFFLVLLAVPGVRSRRARTPATTTASQPIRRADAGQLVRA
jgi:hypothetical protein